MVSSTAHNDTITKAVILLILTHFLWSTNQVIGKVLVVEIPPITLGTLRWMIALPFLFFLLRGVRIRLVPETGLKWLLALALSGIFGFNSLLYLSLAFISASRSAIIYGLTPAIIAILSILVLKEAPTKPQTLGIAISILGLLVITSGFSPGQVVITDSVIGDLIALGASLSWAFYTVAGRKVMSGMGYTPLQTTFYAALYSLPFGLTATILELSMGSKLAFSPLGFLLLFYISVVVAGVGFSWWYVAVRIVGSNMAAPFSNLIPVFVAILGFLILGERLTQEEVVGGGLVVFGAFVASYWRTGRLSE